MLHDHPPPSLEELSEALNFVDPNMCRNDWVRVLMGIKHEFGETGRDVAESWSKGGDSYNSNNFAYTWKNSIHADGGVTVKTVFGLATNNGYKPEQKVYSPEERAAFAKQQEQRAKARAEREALAAAERQQWHETIANLAAAILSQFTIQVKSNKYLSNKKVHGYGTYGVKAAFIAVIRPGFVTELITGGPEIKQFFDNLPDERDFSFLHIKRGDLAIPLMDIEKKIWNLQIINSTGTKLFLKNGRKSGCFHFIGTAKDSDTLAIAEGYATGASVHMATKWPCAVALDAGNLPVVAKHLKQKLPDKKFVICADDDADTKGNPGITKATEAADAVDGIMAVPAFGGA